MRGAGTVEAGLPVQSRRDHLLRPVGIFGRRDEQRPGVLGCLEQAGHQDGRPQAQRMRRAFGFKPALEPARNRAIGAPGERGPAPEHLPIQTARLAPRIQDLIRRRPVPGSALAMTVRSNPSLAASASWLLKPAALRARVSSLPRKARGSVSGSRRAIVANLRDKRWRLWLNVAHAHAM
jgi:hypothetical protein